MDSLKDKVAFISGGASGIGLAIATLLVGKGAKVVLADKNAELGPKSAASLGEAASFVPMNQAVATDVENAVQFVDKTLGRLDLAVICAGVQGPLGPIDALEVQGIDDTLTINLIGVAYCLKYLTGYMKAKKTGGSIVNIASICGVRSTPFFSVFSASKAGVISLTEGCARESLSS